MRPAEFRKCRRRLREELLESLEPGGKPHRPHQLREFAIQGPDVSERALEKLGRCHRFDGVHMRVSSPCELVEPLHQRVERGRYERDVIRVRAVRLEDHRKRLGCAGELLLERFESGGRLLGPHRLYEPVVNEADVLDRAPEKFSRSDRLERAHELVGDNVEPVMRAKQRDRRGSDRRLNVRLLPCLLIVRPVVLGFSTTSEEPLCRRNPRESFLHWAARRYRVECDQEWSRIGKCRGCGLKGT